MRLKDYYDNQGQNRSMHMSVQLSVCLCNGKENINVHLTVQKFERSDFFDELIYSVHLDVHVCV